MSNKMTQYVTSHLIEGKSVFQTVVVMLVAIGSFLVVGGCASKGVPPVDKITNVDRAINAAREGNAIVHAPLELRLAEENLRKARTAISEEDYDKANRLSDEALIDARYAEAKSRSDKTKKFAQEMRDSIDTLRREIERAKTEAQTLARQAETARKEAEAKAVEIEKAKSEAEARAEEAMAKRKQLEEELEALQGENDAPRDGSHTGRYLV